MDSFVTDTQALVKFMMYVWGRSLLIKFRIVPVKSPVGVCIAAPVKQKRKIG